jgi:hypothetical protein
LIQLVAQIECHPFRTADLNGRDQLHDPQVRVIVEIERRNMDGAKT